MMSMTPDDDALSPFNSVTGRQRGKTTTSVVTKAPTTDAALRLGGPVTLLTINFRRW